MFQDQDEYDYLYGDDDFDCWCSNTCSNPPIVQDCDLIFGRDCSPVTCRCGNDTLVQTLVKDLIESVNQRCCVPSTCESPGFCSQGHIIPVSSYCDNQNNPTIRCYKSYPESEVISKLSQFACPDKCVPILDMCQGIVRA